MGSPPQPPTPSSFSPFGPFATLHAAAPPGRDGSTAHSFPFDDSRDEKQKERILEIIKISDVVSEKAAQHDETCLAQVADEEEGSAHNLGTLPRRILAFLSVLKGRAQEGRSEHNHLDLIMDSGASLHVTGNLRLLSEFTREPGGSSAAVYNRKLIPKLYMEYFAAAFTKERVEICPTRWQLASFASSSTNPGGVAESETSLLLDSGASIHAVGEARLLTSIELFSIDKWAVLPDGTRMRIVGTGTMQTDRFSIPKVHLVDGLKKNLISVSQLDKDHGLCCCFHSKKCEVILADGTVVGGAILQDDGMYELYFLEVPAEPEE